MTDAMYVPDGNGTLVERRNISPAGLAVEKYAYHSTHTHSLFLSLTCSLSERNFMGQELNLETNRTSIQEESRVSDEISRNAAMTKREVKRRKRAGSET